MNQKKEPIDERLIILVPKSLKKKILDYAYSKSITPSVVVRQYLVDLVDWKPGEESNDIVS